MKKNIRLVLKSVKNSGISFTFKKVILKGSDNFLSEAKTRVKFDEQKNLIDTIDISPKQLKDNSDILLNEDNLQTKVSTVNWLLPDFEHILYGGIYTILRFIESFQKRGIKNRIIIYDNPYSDVLKKRKLAVKEFPGLKEVEFIGFNGEIDSVPESDAVVSTFWTSAFLSVKIQNTKKKFYFVQDYEPLFYSANSYYALAEATYRFGFKGIVNTPGLAHFLRSQHNMDCKEFYPCVDNEIYNISEEEIETKMNRDVLNVFIYGRPKHDRNAFELAIATLIKLKKKYGNKINIYSAGDVWNEKEYGVENVIKNLGRLGSLKEVANLYRKCDIGLVFMFTKHPSYQPFEYMSCGCAVVTNYNKDNIWFLKNEENCILTEPTPSCIVDGVSRLIESRELRKKIILNGIGSVKVHRWNDECDRIFNYINNLK